mgnify:CR=1 FL=1
MLAGGVLEICKDDGIALVQRTGVGRAQKRRANDERDDRIHDEALAYLSREHDAPMFAVVSYHAPHNPFWAPDELVARFDGAMPRLRPACSNCAYSDAS